MSKDKAEQNDQARRLTSVARRMDHPNSRPRDAATLIIVDERGSEPRILMGRRSDRHTFLPGKFVFPGGRVDCADHRLTAPVDLAPETTAKLMVDMKGGADPKRARALGLTALRETYEETGLVIGQAGEQTMTSRSQSWREFLAHGISPTLSSMRFIARAITPPRRPRRYDTRFFCVPYEAVAKSVNRDENELLDLHWIGISETGTLDLPTITQVILEDLTGHLKRGGLPDQSVPIPYYFMRNGQFLRTLI